MTPYPLRLLPAFKDYLWGGERLKTDFHKKTSVTPLAESWELSCHPAGESTVENGPLAGRPLSAVLQQNPGWTGSAIPADAEFPLLIKFIDAKDNLSVQVHPDDAYARRTEHSAGKTEMWVIVDCEEGAELIYGFRRPVTREEFRRRIEDGTLLEIVNRVPVHKGDVFFIEATTLHAIGKGILIAEIQQSSNITYRVFDYNRRDKDGHTRPLHIDQALAVTSLTVPAGTGRPQGEPERLGGSVRTLLQSCRYFTVYRLEVETEAAVAVDHRRFVHLLCLDGEGELQCGAHRLAVRKGDSVFLPAGSGETVLRGRMTLLQTAP